MAEEQKRVQPLRYWVFEYAAYYPGGGTTDLIGTYETLEEIPRGRTDYQEVVDTHTMTVRLDGGEWEPLFHSPR